MSKPISIRSCHNCRPDLWKPLHISVGTYRCKSCNSLITNVLEKKKGAKE